MIMCYRIRIFVLCFFLLVPYLCAQPDPCSTEPFILFILDFSDFMCPACLDSLFSICAAMPISVQKTNIRGIVVYSNEVTGFQEERGTQILLKKIRGFQKANRIRFPLILDKDGMFAAAAQKGSCVIMIDSKASTLIRFAIPLSPGEFSQMLRLLSENL